MSAARADILVGEQGDDIVRGRGSNADTLSGGSGSNMIFGSASEIDETFVVSAAILAQLDCSVSWLVLADKKYGQPGVNGSEQPAKGPTNRPNCPNIERAHSAS